MTSSEPKERKSKPTDADLKLALGFMREGCAEILQLASQYEQEWKYDNAKIGWQLKVGDGKKALFWLTPLMTGFSLSFALRELEREALLHAQLPENLLKELRRAKKYPEGYAFRILVENLEELDFAWIIVSTLVNLRG